MNWKNKDDHHHTTSNHEPLVDDKPMIKQERILEIHTDHSDIKSVSEWKCRNCGNKVSGPYAPSTCPVCNAQDSYVPIH